MESPLVKHLIEIFCGVGRSVVDIVGILTRVGSD